MRSSQRGANTARPRRRTARSLDELYYLWGEVGVSPDDLERTLGPDAVGSARDRTHWDDLYTRLRATFTKSKAAQQWLQTPNRYLAGTTPLDAVRNGEFERVEAALKAHDSGISP